ncbi:MAG: tol-pal system YbgF family protein [Candidatus Thorarchaeota archaeon]
MSTGLLTEGIVALAVIWDERAGPTIVSLYPSESLSDPVSIALQIYLSSVAVFGQHQQAQRIDFSLPLLSISANHLVRVAFDSWPDSEVRGELRPFYIGFIMDKEADRLIMDDLSNNIWNFIDDFKIQKLSYNIKPAWEFINDRYYSAKLGLNKQSIVEINLDGDYDYSVIQAVRDIEIANDLWIQNRDKRALPMALKSAYKLDNIEHQAAGHAYFLSGTIFFQTGDLENALEQFNKATESFKRAEDLDNAAEAMFNVAITAFRLEKYELAKTNIILSSDIQQDVERKARMFLQLAKVNIKLKEYDSASNSFELALENALKINNHKMAAEILSHYAYRLVERAQETEDDVFRTTLLELAASRREKASEQLMMTNDILEAGSSLVLASKIYLRIKNDGKVRELLLRSRDLFLSIFDYISAVRVILDILYIKKSDYEFLEQIALEALGYTEKNTEDESKSVLQARILNELAKINQIKNDGWKARSFYEEALKTIKNSSNSDYIKIGLNFANFLFQVEDYKSSGDIFLIISQKLGPDNNQTHKSLKNAQISYRRAITGYISGGTTLLHEKRIDEAFGMYKEALTLLKKSYEITIGEDRNQLKELINQVHKSLKQKHSLFSPAYSNQIELMFEELDK